VLAARKAMHAVLHGVLFCVFLTQLSKASF